MSHSLAPVRQGSFKMCLFNFLRQTLQSKAELSSYILEAVSGICLRCCCLFSISQPCCCIPSDQGIEALDSVLRGDSWSCLGKFCCVWAAGEGRQSCQTRRAVTVWSSDSGEEGAHTDQRGFGSCILRSGFDLVWKVWLQAAGLPSPAVHHEQLLAWDLSWFLSWPGVSCSGEVL